METIHSKLYIIIHLSSFRCSVHVPDKTADRKPGPGTRLQCVCACRVCFFSFSNALKQLILIIIAANMKTKHSVFLFPPATLNYFYFFLFRAPLISSDLISFPNPPPPFLRYYYSVKFSVVLFSSSLQVTAIHLI